MSQYEHVMIFVPSYDCDTGLFKYNVTPLDPFLSHFYRIVKISSEHQSEKHTLTNYFTQFKKYWWFKIVDQLDVPLTVALK